MVVRIRLARLGVRNDPIYHLVAIQGRKRRNAKPLEQLGIYSPRPLTQIHRPSLIQLVNAVEGAKAGDARSEKLLRRGMAEGGVREVRKECRWDVDRIRYWLGVGAQPSDSAMRLMKTGGIINNWSDLELLRSKTIATGTKPGLPGLKIASTKRSPEAAMSKFRKRGLLPAETVKHPDGSLSLPPSITPDGKPLHLSAPEVHAALERATQLLQKTPMVFLNRRHMDPQKAEEQLLGLGPGGSPSVVDSTSDADFDALAASSTSSDPVEQEVTRAVRRISSKGLQKKWKRDPAWWRNKRKHRATAFALTGHLKALRIGSAAEGKAAEAVKSME